MEEAAAAAARCRRAARPAATLAVAVAEVDGRVRYNAYNWGSNGV